MSPNRRNIIIAVFLCAALTLLFASIIHYREPRYNGMLLSEWLTYYHDHREKTDAEYEAARQAVRAIGTDALPCLVRWTKARVPRSRFEFWIGRAAGHWPSFLDPRRFREDMPLAVEGYRRSALVTAGFEILGTTGTPAIPALTRTVLSDGDEDSRNCALGALARIGPPAMPHLLSLATNRNTPIWKDAFRWIAIGYTNAAPIVPALVNCLTNRDSEFAVSAAIVLGIGGYEIEATIPACINLLNQADPETRSLALHAIGLYGTRAHSCVSAVKVAMNDSDSKVRETAAAVLPRISAESSTPGPAP